MLYYNYTSFFETNFVKIIQNLHGIKERIHLKDLVNDFEKYGVWSYYKTNCIGWSWLLWISVVFRFTIRFAHFNLSCVIFLFFFVSCMRTCFFFLLPEVLCGGKKNKVLFYYTDSLFLSWSLLYIHHSTYKK